MGPGGGGPGAREPGLKVLHVPYTYHPESVGGTEVYVEGLVGALADLGVESAIAAPGDEATKYEHRGARVWRYTLPPVRDVADLYDLRLEPDGFARILDAEHPDVVHMHALTRGVSAGVAQAAKRSGAMVVFTYHTPSVSCQRGTLMRWGREVCEGVIDVRVCSQCVLQGLGAGDVGGRALGALPPSIGRVLGRISPGGGAPTALRMPELMRLRRESFRALMSEVDHVVVVAEWIRDVLRVNDVPDGKVSLSRHGLQPLDAMPTTARAAGDASLRIVFAGRAAPLKGLRVLVDAIRLAPAARLSLDVFAVVQSPADRRYLADVTRDAAPDRRVRFFDPLPNAELARRLPGYDLVAVPSQCLETGPLVVAEAFAANRPVIGSNLGGIREQVEDGVNGRLVEAGSTEDWARALRHLAEDRAEVARLAAGVRPPRAMSAVAVEMHALYEELTARSATPR